MEQHNSATGSN